MQTNKTLLGLAVAGLIAGGALNTSADVGVAGTKLIVVDKVAASGTAKAVFVAKDQNISKGPGTDTATIGGQLQMSYDNGTDPAINGAFDSPLGSSNWLVNKSTVAKYVNKVAPTGGGTKVNVIKPGNLVKVVGKNTGDAPLDILSQGGAASGDAHTAFCLSNDSFSECYCSDFAGCAWKSIAGGSGAKLACKGGIADGNCGAITSRCVGGVPNDVLEPGEECDDGNANDGDGCTKSCTLCGSSGGVGTVSSPLECQTTTTCKTGANNGLPCDPANGNGDCGSGFCTTNNIPGCDGNCTVPTCGNLVVSGSETCDDGNDSDFDACPADCIVDTCDNPGGSYSISVNFAGSESVAGITVFLDYPEGQVVIPGSGGDASVQNAITNLPGFAFGQPNDLDHALIEAVADLSAFPSGLLFNVDFESCNGATPTTGEFSCTVLSAGDENLVPIPGVTCSVSIP